MRLDMEYIERRGLALDLSILVRTIPAVLVGKGPTSVSPWRRAVGAPIHLGAGEEIRFDQRVRSGRKIPSAALAVVLLLGRGRLDAAPLGAHAPVALDR